MRFDVSHMSVSEIGDLVEKFERIRAKPKLEKKNGKVFLRVE